MEATIMAQREREDSKAARRITFPIATRVLVAKPRTRVKGLKPVRSGTKTKGAYKAGANGVHVFTFAELKPTRASSKKHGEYYTDTQAVVIEGKKIMVGMSHEKAGMGAQLHTHPNDQFNFVLKGTLRVQIEGQPDQLVPAGAVVYFPAGVAHASCATADEDVVFYVCKDLAWSLAGIPVDKKKASGPQRNVPSVRKLATARNATS
ncbi:MAG TPA: cupin domain-containing protein [Sulfuricaulis sp.]|nr:cupin domain-containing protein [Sulfuricaulis sp.]